MSFAYLALYTGDYLRDTRHLSCCEHGIFLLLIMHCWDSRGPVPLDEKKIAGISGARSGDEIEAMRRVLNEFFVKMEDGWYNRRIQLEIERAQAISSKRKSAGFKGYQARAKQLPSKSSASASNTTPTTISTPTTTPNTTTNPKGKIVGIPADVSKDTWEDFKNIRRAKRAPLTQTALNGIIREAKKAGLPLNDVLRICCERGWQSFDADWDWRPKKKLNQKTESEAFIEMVRQSSEKDVTNG